MKYWIIGAIVVISLGYANYIMEEREQAANEAYRLRVVAQRKAAKDKAFNDLAARGEFMTTFAAVKK